MKIAYNMFHIDENIERKKNVDLCHKVFSEFDWLDTPTFKISNNIQLLEFIRKNKDFYFNPEGYSLDGKQGWRYGELGIWADRKSVV